MNQYLSRTWVLLRGNWILLSILILETLVMLIFKGGEVGLTPNFSLEIALYFFHLAVLGGWLFQMKRVVLDPGHRTNWDDFFHGVARYFGPMLGGGAMFMLVSLMGVALSMALAGALSGPPDMKLVEQLWQLMQTEKTQQLQAMVQQPSPAMLQLESWIMTFLGGIFVLGVFTSTLSFWTHWCVLSDSSWIKAWSSSQQTLFRHWKAVLWLGLIWLFPTGMIYTGFLSGVPPIAMVAFFLSLLAKTYFSLLFCLFLSELEPDRVVPVPPLAASTSS